MDSLDTIFLVCFVFGALFTLATVLLGSLHVPGVHAHVGGHGHGHAHIGTSADQVPWLNASSIVGGLTVFGAIGYVLPRLSDWALPAILVGALLGGAISWFLIARFLGFVLSGEREMDPADYRLEGTVGQITIGIPAGGTGEVVYSKAGARRSEAARALGAAPIPRGTEVVITRYADGFATVQPWGEFIAARERIGAEHSEA